MNPHFIFNALNSIQSFIYNREPEEANQFIVQFAKLMRLILESTSKNFSYLKDEIELINLYVSLEQLRFNNKFEYKLNIDEDIYKKDIIVPSTILQPFVENAINHGIAPKTTKSILKINVTIKEDFLCCIIEDDGIGREEAARRKKSSHTSRAMNIIQERKQILKKRDNIDIDFNFEDLKNPIGTGTGTRVTILVPTNIAN
jgi:LytS/YehU family sensor histidine kinase